jgi:glycosyltransferase involved in cell wall biosynthesis
MKSYLKSIKKIEGLFVISTSLKDYFITKGVAEDKIQIINMIVDSTRFDEVHKNKQQNNNYIAYCGNSSNSKDGVDDLIKAFALVTQKHPYCKLYLVGIVPIKSDYDFNMSLIKQLGIQDKVVHCGIVPYAEMPQLLKDARILALDRPLTEQAKYGFPTKLGEYLSTGNIVVVTNVGDIPLFLKDGESALLAEPKNEHEFAEKICWALEHPSESNKIGQKGKEVAKKCFNYIRETRKIAECMLDNSTF